MPSINLTLPTAGSPITAGLHATNYAALQALLNGGLDSSNVNFASGGVVPFPSLGITLGGDVNLYRASANVLKTDDSLHVGNFQIDNTNAMITGHASMDWRSVGDVYVSAQGVAGTVTLRNLTSGNYGLIMQASGRVDLLGVGLTLGSDVNLYRGGADFLQTDDSFRVSGAGGYSAVNGPAGRAVFYTSSSGDSQNRFLFDSGGAMSWGPGNAAMDTNLYRESANLLRTDDDFAASLDIQARRGSTPTVVIGGRGPGGEAGIHFGSALDTNLYRSAATVLKTDGAFHAVGGLIFQPGIWHIDSGGGQRLYFNATQQNYYKAPAITGILHEFRAGDDTAQVSIETSDKITFGAARDTNIYRSAANILQTDDNFRIRRSEAAGTAIAADVFSAMEGISRLQINNDGTIYWGDGVAAHDLVISRGAANELRMGAGDIFKVSNAGIKFDDNTVQTTAAAAGTIGQEVAYAERTSDLAVSTTIADLVDSGSVTYANVAHIIDFFLPAIQGPASAQGTCQFHLYDGATDLGVIASVGHGAWGSGNIDPRHVVRAARRITPTAGSHNYKIRAVMDANTATAFAGTGGAGLIVPAFIRVTRVT